MANKGANVIIITKKAKAAAGHSGGAWKVAYADFVTAMMALFIVLWLLSQTDQSTRQKLSEYFRTGMFSGAPSVVMGGAGVTESGFIDTSDGILQMDQKTLMQGEASLREIMAEVSQNRGDLSAVVKDIDISVTDEGLLIQILDSGEDLLFDLSSAELKPRLKMLLEMIAPVLGKLKNQIQVHGHTDARPFPAAAGRTNWELSFERANNARRCLEGHGLSSSQMSGVFAHGSAMLYVKSNPNDPRNRRLAILAMRRGYQGPATRGMLPADIAAARPSESAPMPSSATASAATLRPAPSAVTPPPVASTAAAPSTHPLGR